MNLGHEDYYFIITQYSQRKSIQINKQESFAENYIHVPDF